MQFLVFIAALLLSAIFTRLVRDFANRHGWATPPASDRHIHTRPTPRLGGVAIFLTLWCIALLAHWVPEHFGMTEFPLSQLTVKILGPATIIFLLGLIDDFVELSAYIKFSVQALAAVLLYCNGIGISRLTLLAGHPHLGWLVGLPLTILWVLRSEEHTSELQSLRHLVCRLLLEKKKVYLSGDDIVIGTIIPRICT